MNRVRGVFSCSILASIETILVSIVIILRRWIHPRIPLNINFRCQFPSKLTSIVTILSNIKLAGEHIFQVLAQYKYSTILASIEQVNTPLLVILTKLMFFHRLLHITTRKGFQRWSVQVLFRSKLTLEKLLTSNKSVFLRNVWFLDYRSDSVANWRTGSFIITGSVISRWIISYANYEYFGTDNHQLLRFKIILREGHLMN